ncbi:MAG TPA: transposase [Acetobacteraceae bacterium]|nr:transposase [Acetobacteraceae bacterium]
MTAPSRRIEVITRGERRRRWSIEEKREIVAESLGPGVRPSEIFHRHGISSSQLYAWRQQLARRVGGQPTATSFALVDVATDEHGSPVPVAPTVARAKPPAQVPAMARMRGLIEIVLPGGLSVRVDGHVDERALRCVLDALRER